MAEQPVRNVFRLLAVTSIIDIRQGGELLRRLSSVASGILAPLPCALSNLFARTVAKRSPQKWSHGAVPVRLAVGYLRTLYAGPGETGREFAHVPCDGGLRIDNMDHGVNTFMKEQGAIVVVGGRGSTVSAERRVAESSNARSLTPPFTRMSPRDAFVNPGQCSPLTWICQHRNRCRARQGLPASPALP